MTAGLVFRLLRAGEGPLAKALPEDLADAATLGSERGAARLLRRRLLRSLTAEMLAVHPDRIRFERGETGRVQVVAPEPLFASESGRGCWTALALAPHPVGVDVETWPPQTPMPLDLLHPLERDEILAAPDPGRTFLRFWTAREAWLKSDGRGFAVMPDQVRATAAEDGVGLDEGRAKGLARIVEREDAIAAIVERGLGE